MVLDVSSAPAPVAPPASCEDILPVEARPVLVSLPRRRVRRSVLYTALGLCAFIYAFTHWFLWPVRISGESMAPNYDDGQAAVINRLAYFSNSPQRGDVVGLRVGHEFYLKRIVGLPGERIEFQRDTVVVNGRPLKEPYPVKPLLWKLAPVQLGANDYYVMGDNRTMSKLGPVPRELIIGKSLF